MKVLAWCIDPNGVENTNTVKNPYPNGITSEILIKATQMIEKKMIADPHWYKHNHRPGGRWL